MKKILSTVLGLFVGVPMLVYAAGSIFLPVQGGTGISTIPTYGQMLVGNAGGTYTLTSTLGVANGGTASTTLGGILAGNGTNGVISANLNGLAWDGSTLSVNQLTNLSYFEYGQMSTSSPYYYKMSPTATSTKTTLTYSGINTSRLLQTWITEPFSPGVLSIPRGDYVVEVYAAQTANITAGEGMYAEIWETDSTGKDIGLIATTNKVALTAVELKYDLSYTRDTVYTMASASSRIAVKKYWTRVSGTDTVTFSVGDGADTHLSLPSSVVDITGLVPYTNWTQNVTPNNLFGIIAATSTFTNLNSTYASTSLFTISGSAADTDHVFDLRNGAGTIQSSFLGNGNFRSTRAILGSTTAAFARSDSPLELVGSMTDVGAPIMVLRDETPSASLTYPEDFGYTMYAKNSLNTSIQLGSFFGGWLSSNDATTGYSYLGLHPNTAGGTSADIALMVYGGNGATFFQPDVNYSSHMPGKDILSVLGREVITGNATAEGLSVLSKDTASLTYPISWARSDSAVGGVLGFDDVLDNSIIIGSGTNHPLSLVVNKARRMYIGTNGFIGMNTLAPTNLLTAALDYSGTDYGQIAATGSTTINKQTSIGYNTGSDYGFITALERGVGYKNLILQYAGGNVGVGTTTPWATLAVNPIAGKASNQFVVGSSTATSFVVNNSGNVGIGTTGPGAKLHIQNTATNATIVNGLRIHNGGSGTGTGSSIGVGYGDGTNVSTLAGMSGYYDGTGPALGLFTGTTNTERVTVLNNGNVGIGTTTPWATLAVNPVAGSAANQFVVGSSTATSFIVKNSGNVGIGTTAPGAQLEIVPPAGSVNVFPFKITAGTGQNLFAAFTAPSGYGNNFRFQTPASNYWDFGTNRITSTNDFSIYSSTLGADTVHILQNGNVGIGTTTPSNLFNISGAYPQLTLDNPSSGSGDVLSLTDGGVYRMGIGNFTDTASLQFATGGINASGTGLTTRMSIDSTGNVGIGTTTPRATFAVNPVAGKAVNQFIVGSSTATSFLIDNSGNVGVSTTSPSQALSVTGKGYFTQGVQFGDGTVQTTAASGGGTFPFTPTSNWGINTNATSTAMSFFAGISASSTSHIASTTFAVSGFVGIGTTSPTDTLVISNDTQVQLSLNNNTSGNGSVLKFSDAGKYRQAIGGITDSFGLQFATGGTNAAGSSLTTRMNIGSTGLVGIGTSTKAATLLEIGGSTPNVTFDGYKSCTALTSDANGLLGCTISDERLKTDILSLNDNTQLNSIMKLNPVSFYYKSATHGAGLQMGLIAQQVKKVFPNLITITNPTPDTPDGTMTVNYTALISPVISAIQSMEHQILAIINRQNAQEKEIQQLQVQVRLLQAQVNNK